MPNPHKACVFPTILRVPFPFDKPAAKAVQLASRWPESWVSKVLRSCAYGWFFFDPTASMAVFGGREPFLQVFESDCIEKHFTRGIGSLCGGEYEEALQAFRAADRLEQNNPFINMCIAIVLIEQGAPDALSAIEHCYTVYKGHPLLSLIRFDRAA